jgi:hypothetical protein
MLASMVALYNSVGLITPPLFGRRTQEVSKKLTFLVVMALMLAMMVAMSGVAQAAPTIGSKADAKCLAEAAKTVEQPGFNPSNYTFHGGTESNDNFTTLATAGPDVFCGFGGDDQIATLGAGDIFLGGENGAGFDQVGENNGTFYGGEGADQVGENNGTFYGGAGDDFVIENSAGATFYGGEGNDSVDLDNFGTFYGEEGNDHVIENHAGATFYGGAGNDRVDKNFGTFYGGEGCDRVDVGTPPVDGPEGPCTI